MLQSLCEGFGHFLISRMAGECFWCTKCQWKENGEERRLRHKIPPSFQVGFNFSLKSSILLISLCEKKAKPTKIKQLKSQIQKDNNLVFLSALLKVCLHAFSLKFSFFMMEKSTYFPLWLNYAYPMFFTNWSVAALNNWLNDRFQWYL